MNHLFVWGPGPALRAALLLLLLTLASCAAPADGPVPGGQRQSESRDFSCSYFYFLWGSHAEYKRSYAEAVDAFEKALVCDPTADYIRRKLPLLHIKQGDNERAAALLAEAVSADPQDTGSRALLARLLVQQKDFQAAIAAYEEILSYEPDNEQTLLRLGILLGQTGEPERARTFLNRLVNVNPESYFGHLALARIEDRPERALLHFERALALNWSVELSYEVAEFHLRQQQYEKAIELLRAVLEAEPAEEQARLTIVQALLAMDREEEAVAELSLIPRFRNNPVQISLVLSRLYLRLGAHSESIAHLEAVLKTEDSAEARYLLGALYFDIDRADDALSVLDGIGPDREEFEDAVFLQTRILHQLNRTPRALAKLESYIRDESTRRPMFYILAASLYRDTERPAKSTDMLARAYRLYPDDERILFEYGLQLERTGELEAAISVMEELLVVNPDHAEALNFVGYSWADTNRNLDRALEYITRAVEMKPDNGYIQDSLGWVYFRLGDLDRARKELHGALRILPEDPHIHEHLGDVYRALGETGEALKYYRQAFDLFENPEKKASVQEKIDTLAD